MKIFYKKILKTNKPAKPGIPKNPTKVAVRKLAPKPRPMLLKKYNSPPPIMALIINFNINLIGFAKSINNNNPRQTKIIAVMIPVESITSPPYGI
jgi:hypothetical protein